MNTKFTLILINICLKIKNINIQLLFNLLFIKNDGALLKK